MKLDRWALVAEIVSGVAIVITLIILILEVRSNTQAIQAETTFNVVTTYRDQNARLVENVGGLADIMFKVSQGEILTGLEEYRYRLWLRDLLDDWEWFYFEVEQGRLIPQYLDPELWAQFWSENPVMSEEYEESRVGRNPRWLRYMEQNVFPLVPSE